MNCHADGLGNELAISTYHYNSLVPGGCLDPVLLLISLREEVQQTAGSSLQKGVSVCVVVLAGLYYSPGALQLLV